MSYDLQITAGDLVFENGDLATLQGRDKLEQDLTKIILTEAGANPAQPWYGSLVSANLIGSSLPPDIIISTAQSQLQKAIQILQQLQANQVSTGQKMSPDEQIAAIQQISLNQDPVDPRVINIIVRVLSKASASVSTSISL